MKKVEFFLSTGYVNGGCKEEFEFEDDATEEEIEEACRAWLWEEIDYGWRAIKEEEE